MSDLTLKEVCTKYGVTRRAIQGYEKLHLITPTARTNKGYLLYNEQMQKKICTIKRLQDCGFHLSEIQKLGSAGPSERKQMLQIRYDSLLDQECRISGSISWLSQIISNL